MIFGHILSGQLFHIYGDGRSDDTSLCSTPISETEAQEHFYATDPESYEQPDKTHGWLGRFSRDGSRHHGCQARFSLAILHACRQIYHEVKDVLYSSNTFSFRNPRAMPIFTSSLLRSSANSCFAIRSLRLDIQLRTDGDHKQWNKAIRNIPIDLPNVQSLCINLDLDFSDQYITFIQYSADVRPRFRLFGELYQLRVLPLKEVVVIVADEDWAVAEREEEWWSVLEVELRWTMGQKQEYATELREVLLGSKKLKVHHGCRK